MADSYSRPKGITVAHTFWLVRIITIQKSIVVSKRSAFRRGPKPIKKNVRMLSCVKVIRDSEKTYGPPLI